MKSPSNSKELLKLIGFSILENTTLLPSTFIEFASIKPEELTTFFIISFVFSLLKKI